LSQIVKNNEKKFWESLKEYKLEQYEGETLAKLTTIGILKLHNSKIDASVENITVTLHKLFPEKFSINNFPEYPDSKMVERAVAMHCTVAGYVDGTLKRNSYLLTGKGQIVAEELLERIESGTLSYKKQSGLRRSKFVRLVKGVTKTSGFKKFSSKDFKQIKKFDVCESLHCTMDADEEHQRNSKFFWCC